MAVMSYNKAEGRLYESTQTRPVPYIQTVGQESGGDDDDDDSDVAPAAWSCAFCRIFAIYKLK